MSGLAAPSLLGSFQQERLRRWPSPPPALPAHEPFLISAGPTGDLRQRLLLEAAMAMTRGWRVGGARARAIENMSSSLKQWKHAVSIISSGHCFHQNCQPKVPFSQRIHKEIHACSIFIDDNITFRVVLEEGIDLEERPPGVSPHESSVPRLIAQQRKISLRPGTSLEKILLRLR